MALTPLMCGNKTHNSCGDIDIDAMPVTESRLFASQKKKKKKEKINPNPNFVMFYVELEAVEQKVEG